MSVQPTHKKKLHKNLVKSVGHDPIHGMISISLHGEIQPWLHGRGGERAVLLHGFETCEETSAGATQGAGLGTGAFECFLLSYKLLDMFRIFGHVGNNTVPN